MITHSNKYSDLQAMLSSKSFTSHFKKCLKIKTKKTYKTIFSQDMMILSTSEDVHFQLRQIQQFLLNFKGRSEKTKRVWWELAIRTVS